MTSNAREVFARIPAEITRPDLDGWQGTYKFDIAGQGVWHASVENGTARIREGDAPADCTIRFDNDDFVRFAAGDLNLLTAWMQGRIEAEGDIGLLYHFHGFMRSDGRTSLEEAA